jgi:hypothetical protein
MDGNEIDRGFHAAFLESFHIFGDLTESRIGLGQLGSVLLDDVQI